MEELNKMPLEKRNFMFLKFAEIAEEWKLTSEMKMVCEDSLRNHLDSYDGSPIENNDDFRDCSKEYLEGFVIGFTKGVVEAMHFVTRNMKKMGLDMGLIQKVTGLTLDEIEEL